MRRVVIVSIALVLLAVLVSPAAAQGPSEQSCWGQASKLFAQEGFMGEHSSSFETPRLGLRNLARDLYAQGVIPDDSMQSLGALVAVLAGYSIETCPELAP